MTTPTPRSPRGRNALISTGRTPSEQPSHPALAAALLMIGVVIFLVVVSVLAVR